MKITKLENILSDLEGVKRIGAMKYMAICPAHLDKVPSLSIGLISHRASFFRYQAISIPPLASARVISSHLMSTSRQTDQIAAYSLSQGLQRTLVLGLYKTRLLQ